jgi:hypothetical protein
MGVNHGEMLNPDAILVASLTGQDEKKERLRIFLGLRKVQVANSSNP